MPLIDLPLDQLHAYTGRNPRPSDFDAFWDKALQELAATPPEKKLEPVVSPYALADCWRLTFQGVGGARIHCKVMTPKAATKAFPCVVFFHGYSVRSPDWWGLAAWVAAGYAVVAMDCRGQAGESTDPGGVSGNTLRGHIIRGLEDGPEHLMYRGVFLDCARTAQLAMEIEGVDPQRVMATGASQGGGLTLAAAALEPRIAKCAPVYPFLSDYRRVWEMDQDVAAYEELRTFFRNRDPRHERVDEIFTRLGYIDVQHLAPRIQAETLMVTGLMDTITPPSTQFAAYNRIGAEKRVLIYPDFGHEGLPDANDLILKFFNES